MFYVKEKTDTAEFIAEITDENVFCTCPDCGKEVNVDLAEVFAGGDGDLYSTAVFCKKCSVKRMKRRNCHE